MRDLLSGLSNYSWPANWRHASDTVNDVSALSGISSLYKTVNFTSKFFFLVISANKEGRVGRNGGGIRNIKMDDKKTE